MRLATPLDRWTALFLATLGCAPVVGCGGRETQSEDTDGGAGGSGGDGGSGGSDAGTGTGGTGTAGKGGGISTGGGPPPPQPGRPFLIEGTARQATACANEEWQIANTALPTEHLDAAQRRRLAHAWTQAALLEHGSIAAFARFTLQLLALGAPASLIEAANAAIADETTHARLAFSMASAYAGRPVGPGALSIEGALEASSLRDVVVAAIREGCLGETVSAVQAAEVRQYVTEPALCAVLTTIADDETRHAQLSWRFVQWALERGDEELVQVARDEFARLRADVDPVPLPALDADELALLAGGAMPERLGAHIRRECVKHIIVPCAAALLARRSPHAAPRAREETSAPPLASR
ncbi:MAG TPA: hypothetical protein VK540_18800 [Polyangiaceae bacterium]|nr:hypothetical protein [Polyangiaceae bacterium]